MQRAQVGSRTGTLLPAAPGPPTGNPGYPPRLHAVEPSTTPRPCRKPCGCAALEAARVHPGHMRRGSSIDLRELARGASAGRRTSHQGIPGWPPTSSNRCTSGRTSHTGFMRQGISRTASSGRAPEFRGVRGGFSVPALALSLEGPSGGCRLVVSLAAPPSTPRRLGRARRRPMPVRAVGPTRRGCGRFAAAPSGRR